MRIGWLVMIVVVMGAVVGMAYGYEEDIASVTKVETTYDTPKPLGQLKVMYAAAKGETKATLKVECDLFKGEVNAKELEDLPRANWDTMEMLYSLTSYDVESKTFVERPYVYVKVPLWGPPGGDMWQRTWVEYHFDDKGACVRKLRRDVPGRSNNGLNIVRVIGVEWPAGKGAEETLKEAE